MVGDGNLLNSYLDLVQNLVEM